MLKISGQIQRDGEKRIMSNKSGVIDNLKEIRRGQQTYYSFVLENDEVLYRTGLVPLPAKVGDTISFDYNAGRKGGVYVDLKTVKVVTTSDKPKSNYSGDKWKDKDTYWERKEEYDRITERRISWAVAHNLAVDIVKLGLENDALTLGTKKASKLDIIIAAIKQVADDLYPRLFQPVEQTPKEEPVDPYSEPDNDNNNWQD